MSSPYIGEIRMFGGNFAPAGWMTCDGQVIPISENDVLFNLIGTTYGGDGQSTFALPNLAARVLIHQGSNGTSSYTIGQNGGVTDVTLTTNQIPVHSHAPVADNNPGTQASPANAYYANTAPNFNFTVPNGQANPEPPIFRNFNAAVLPSQGGSQPHTNLQPFLAITYIISMFGIYPSPT
jgi:microcystin-dependent protein